MATTQAEILINGITYAWSDIVVIILGRKVQGITAISWDQTQEKTNNYGLGNRPVSRSRGNRQATGSVTLSLKEISAIEAALPVGKDILDVKPFPIIVQYKNDDNLFVSYQLRHCEFTNFGHTGSQGDPLVEKELGLIPSQIERIF